MAGHSQAHLDVLARQMGYQNYSQYSAHQQQLQAARMANGINGTGADPGQGQQPPGNWLQNLLARIPIHPSYLLGKVNDAFTKAGQ